MKAWKMAASLAAAVSLCAGLAKAATEAQSGQSTNGNNATLMVGGRVTSTNTMQDLQFDANGTLLMTERYPATQQVSTFTLISTTVAANSSTAMAALTPYLSASIYGQKLLRIATSGFAAAAPWRIKFAGSADCATYSWLMNRNTGASGTDVSVWTENDTLMIKGHGNTVGTLITGGMLVPLTPRGLAGFDFTPTCLGAVFSSDSAAGATGTVVLEILAREK